MSGTSLGTVVPRPNPSDAERARALVRAAIAGGPLAGRRGVVRKVCLPWLLPTVGWWTFLAVLVSGPDPGAALPVVLAGALWLTVFDTLLVHDGALRRLRELGHALIGRQAPTAAGLWRSAVGRTVLAALVVRHVPALVASLVLAPYPMPAAGLWLVGLAVSLIGWIGTVVRTSVAPTLRARSAVGWLHVGAAVIGWMLVSLPPVRSVVGDIDFTVWLSTTGLVTMLAMVGLAQALRRLRGADLATPSPTFPVVLATGDGVGHAADVLIAPTATGHRRWRTTLGLGLCAALVYHVLLRWLPVPPTSLLDVVLVSAITGTGGSAVANLWVSPRWPLMPGAPQRRSLASDLVQRMLRREGPHTLMIGLLAMVGLAAARPDPVACGIGLLPLLPATGLMTLAAVVWWQPRRPAADMPTLTLIASLPAHLVVIVAVVVLNGGADGPLSPGLSAIVSLGAGAALGGSVLASRRAWARLDWARMPSTPPLLARVKEAP